MNADLLGVARDVGREAAQFVADRRPSGRVQIVSTKSSPTDVVTELDKACEQRIYDGILRHRPNDGFIGEEGHGTAGSSGTVWIVDPIDGTVNFVYGLPFYAISMAAVVNGRTEVGLVVNIANGDEFDAIRGGGAFHTSDGAVRSPLQLPREVSLDCALVATGFHYVRSIRATQAAAVARLLPHIRDIRRTGSAALDLCALASGSYDAYVERGLKPWDLAAGRLIAEESGIIFSGPDGEPNERLVTACHPAISREFFGLVQTCGF